MESDRARGEWTSCCSVYCVVRQSSQKHLQRCSNCLGLVPGKAHLKVPDEVSPYLRNDPLFEAMGFHATSLQRRDTLFISR